jgi:hypothetical protein
VGALFSRRVEMIAGAIISNALVAALPTDTNIAENLIVF